jgi:hypothetical protein
MLHWKIEDLPPSIFMMLEFHNDITILIGLANLNEAQLFVAKNETS